MTVEELIGTMRMSGDEITNCMKIGKQVSAVLDESDASFLDAMHILAFMLGSATNILANESGVSLDVAIEAASMLVKSSAEVHSRAYSSPEGMMPN